MEGYGHPGYAQSFREFGAPRELPRSGGWILERPVPGFPYTDAMGCYPLFACTDWSQLPQDMEELRGELVTLSLVTDPFGDFDVVDLTRCFDVMKPFKKHLTVDLTRPPADVVSRHHCYYARKALREIAVQTCEDPSRFLDAWTDLYAILVERHRILGLRALSRSCFAAQLVVPGMVAFRATWQTITVGMLLCYVQRDVAFSHLTALNPLGYSLRAAYAMFWSALEYFASRGMHWLDLGAGAGLDGDQEDGLTRFKRGWSDGTRVAYFCGRVLHPGAYEQILDATGAVPAGYFPAYREGEFS